MKDVDYGYVGDVKEARGDMLARLIADGVVPVLAPLTHDGHGQLLNTNADTIAGEAAKALASYFDVTLVYCFEKKGVLRNPYNRIDNRSNFDRKKAYTGISVYVFVFLSNYRYIYKKYRYYVALYLGFCIVCFMWFTSCCTRYDFDHYTGRFALPKSNLV